MFFALPVAVSRPSAAFSPSLLAVGDCDERPTEFERDESLSSPGSPRISVIGPEDEEPRKAANSESWRRRAIAASVRYCLPMQRFFMLGLSARDGNGFVHGESSCSCGSGNGNSVDDDDEGDERLKLDPKWR